MKKRLRGKFFFLLGGLAACMVLAAAAGLFARQAWQSRQALVSLFAGALPPRPEVNTPQLAPTGLAAARSPLVVSTREINEESVSPRYTIHGQWPVLEWGGDPRVEAFNQAVEEIVDQEVLGFKEGMAQPPDNLGLDEPSSSLEINYTTTNTTKGILSVLMRISVYTAGAAHPGSYSHAVNYDLRRGETLALASLFKPDADFLDTISAYCLDDLKARGVLGWEDGAMPNAENYKIWNVTPNGLLITFDEYQVAPYAAGPQAVTVSYAVLKDMIRPDSPLAEFIPLEK